MQWLGLYTFTAKGMGPVPGQRTKVPHGAMMYHIITLIREDLENFKALESDPAGRHQGYRASCWRHTIQFSSVQSLSRVWLFATPWVAARQASLSITNSQSSPKLMSIESMMPSNHLILRHPLLLPPPIPPSIRVFSNESTLHMRWPKYWEFQL